MAKTCLYPVTGGVRRLQDPREFSVARVWFFKVSQPHDLARLLEIRLTLDIAISLVSC